VKLNKKSASLEVVRAVLSSGSSLAFLLSSGLHRSWALAQAVAKIVDALEAAGITFLPERGGSVGLRGRVKS